jgi:periplasmic protein TonB
VTLLAETPLAPRSDKRAAARRRLRTWLALLAACLLHAGVAAIFLVSKHGAHVAAAPPMGDVELMMVEQKGRTDAKPVPPSPPQPDKPSGAPPSTQQAQAVEPHPAVPPPVPPLPAEPPKPNAEAVPAAPPPPSAPEKPKPPPQQAPVFDLAGTDSDTNAEAMGDHILPATPDSGYRNRAPVYPESAAENGQQGSVIVLIHVTADGLAAGVEVLETSGVAALDDAALTAVRQWHFRPAIKDGRAVPFDMPFRFVFSAR